MSSHEFYFVVCSYLLGSVPFGYLIFYLSEGKDIRGLGSGNIGATNVLRSKGKLAGLATLLLDVLKGALPIVYGRIHFDLPWIVLLGGLAVLLGHVFPVFLKFRGGKGRRFAGRCFPGLLLSGPAGIFACFFSHSTAVPICVVGLTAGCKRAFLLHPVHPGRGSVDSGFSHVAADRVPAPRQHPAFAGRQ